MTRVRSLGAAMLACFATLAMWLAVASPNGDLWNRWTDHLRHAGEAVVLLERGPHLYLHSYRDSTAGVTLPCPEHAELWPDTGVPYPPLGVLAHAPLALAERSGWLAPPTAHRLQVCFFGLVGLLALVVGAASLRGGRRILFVSVFGPLIVGVGFSGFVDTLWLACALSAMAFRSPALSTLGFLFHFRGIVGLGAVRWSDARRKWPLGVLIALNLVIAVIAGNHLGAFEPFTRWLHYSQLSAWWFPLATTALAVHVRKEVSPVLIALAALTLFTDAQPSFWHLLVLVPVGLEAMRTLTPRKLAWVMLWVFASAQVYLHTWVPFPLKWLTYR